MPGSPARANPLLAPLPCQAFTDRVRLGGIERTVFTIVTPAGVNSVFLDAPTLDTWIGLLTEARGQMTGLITGPSVPPGLGPPNGNGPPG